jgi:hypothetical protein
MNYNQHVFKSYAAGRTKGLGGPDLARVPYCPHLWHRGYHSIKFKKNSFQEKQTKTYTNGHFPGNPGKLNPRKSLFKQLFKVTNSLYRREQR